MNAILLDSPWVMDIIQHFYPDDNMLRHILLQHSRSVRDYALACGQRHPELQLDTQLVADAAMLHDLGIFRCHAPGIYCEGNEPYICHGRIGAELLRGIAREEGRDLEPYARVCERHTGAGLTAQEIVEQQLPLPPLDFLPETTEEKLICYADKFFSKSGDRKEKTPKHVKKSLARFGEAGLKRFLEWEQLFG